MILQYPTSSSLESQQGENEIVIQVSNFIPQWGNTESLITGNENQIIGLRDRSIAYELLYLVVYRLSEFIILLYFCIEKNTLLFILLVLLIHRNKDFVGRRKILHLSIPRVLGNCS